MTALEDKIVRLIGAVGPISVADYMSLVLSDPDTYAEATAELKANDMSVSLPFRQRMAARTFAKTSRYDAMIAEYLTKN